MAINGGALNSPTTGHYLDAGGGEAFAAGPPTPCSWCSSFGRDAAVG